VPVPLPLTDTNEARPNGCAVARHRAAVQQHGLRHRLELIWNSAFSRCTHFLVVFGIVFIVFVVVIFARKRAYTCCGCGYLGNMSTGSWECCRGARRGARSRGC
jgi:hypothetical protein